MLEAEKMNCLITEPVRCGYCGLPYKDMSSVQKHQTMMHNLKDKLNARMGKKFFSMRVFSACISPEISTKESRERIPFIGE